MAKIIPFFSFLACYATTTPQDCTIEQRIDQITEYNAFIDQIAEQNAFGDWQGKSGSATICEGFVAHGSYLLIRAQADSLDYAQVITLTGGFPEGIDVDLNLLEPKFEWSNGFQVGLGYVFSQRQQWDVTLDWTAFESTAKNSTTVPVETLADKMIRPSWLPFLMGSANSEGFAQWKAKYNTLDFMIGRQFFSGKWLSFHAKLGLRGAFLKQKYFTQYVAFAMVGSDAIPLGEPFYEAKWNYQAIGPRIGTEAQWHMTSEFSIVGNLFGSLPYGKFKLSELFDGAFLVSAAPPIVLPESIQVNKKFNRIRPILEGEIGLRWQKFFQDMSRKATLGVYYGAACWFDQNVMFDEFVFLDQFGNSLVTPLPSFGNFLYQDFRFELGLEF